MQLFQEFKIGMNELISVCLTLILDVFLNFFLLSLIILFSTSCE